MSDKTTGKYAILYMDKKDNPVIFPRLFDTPEECKERATFYAGVAGYYDVCMMKVVWKVGEKE